MNERSQIASAFAAAYVLLKIGIAMFRHPVGAGVGFGILIVFSVVGGASASEVVHAALSFMVTLGLVLIIGLAREGRRVAALLWLIAMLICIAIFRALIDYVAALAARGYLTDYHWWFHRRHLIAFYLLSVSVANIKDIFSSFRPDGQKREQATAPGEPSVGGDQRNTAPEAERRQCVASKRTPIRPRPWTNWASVLANWRERFAH
jgi:hypothetical protein